MRSSARHADRWCSVLVALVLAVPGHARAAPGEGSAVREEAARSERAVEDAGDEVQRTLAYLHAIDAWLRAFAEDADLASSCAARAILTRALADERLDVRARDELRERFDDRAGTASECCAIEADEAEAPTSIALIDPEGPAAGRTPALGDRPRRSPRTIAGASLLALAAPALGGLVYAAFTDLAITRELRERQAKLEASGERNDARITALEAEGRRVIGLEIGLGVAAAALVGAGVGLIAGRRDRSRRSLSIAPHGRAESGGIVLSGRF
ncbi:MAG: hypothetical protein R3B09_00345 [Nannocystaceae bacterium]